MPRKKHLPERPVSLSEQTSLKIRRVEISKSPVVGRVKAESGSVVALLLLGLIGCEMKIEVKSARVVSSWTWKCADDSCGICRNLFDGCCPDCKTPGDDCPIVWGECSHSFHLHCILKWIDEDSGEGARQHCPMCRREWVFQSSD